MSSNDSTDAPPRSRTRLIRRRHLIGVALIAVAAARELSRPAAERTWQGTLGPLPYDLRRPTLARFRERVWNRDDPRLFTPRVFGVGYTVNLGRLVRRPGAPDAG